ncbi:MAG: hypothetical protein ABI548_16870 [Polyangiaceae bacterium]
MSARLRIVSRFPRADAVLESTRIAEALRNGANELDALAGCAHAYEIGTLRRKVRGIVLATVAAAVDAEGCES